LIAYGPPPPGYYDPYGPPPAVYGPPPPGAYYGPPPPTIYYEPERDRPSLVEGILGTVGDIIPGPVGNLIGGIGSILGNVFPVDNAEATETTPAEQQ
jgi:hypothetical protein